MFFAGKVLHPCNKAENVEPRAAVEGLNFLFVVHVVTVVRPVFRRCTPLFNNAWLQWGHRKRKSSECERSRFWPLPGLICTSLQLLVYMEHSHAAYLSCCPEELIYRGLYWAALPCFVMTDSNACGGKQNLGARITAPKTKLLNFWEMFHQPHPNEKTSESPWCVAAPSLIRVRGFKGHKNR